MNVIKRNGMEVSFELDKIRKAIQAANKETGELEDAQIIDVCNRIFTKCQKFKYALNVEEIQDIVEDVLIKVNAYKTSKHYIKYRYQRALDRNQSTLEAKILSTVSLQNEEVKQENANKNPTVLSTQRDYIAGLLSRELTEKYLISKDIVDAHNAGIIHFHDSDYFAQKMFNCCLWNLDDMLQNGTMINGVKIEKPHTFHTACNIATQIMAVVASNQYGGQTINIAHLAPFVDVSRQKYLKEVQEELCGLQEFLLEDYDILVDSIIEKRLKEEIRRGIQTMQYQILTLNSTNGQTPFVSLFMYLNDVEDPNLKKDLALIIEEILKQRINGVKNEVGEYVTPAFPKLLYVLEEDNIHPNSKYYYLTELAAKCTAKRMVPDYISEKIMKRDKINYKNEGDCYGCMGCRSFLTPDRFTGKLGNVANAGNYIPDKPKYFGRFNQGVCTISLPDVACSSKKDLDTFWRIFDERLELCHKALRTRHERLLGTPSDVSPIHWQHGAIARLQPGEKIDKLLYNGYSTISLGYAGLWECVYYMTGSKLTEEAGKEFGLKVMQYMNDKCTSWKQAENIDYSLYGTPIESTTYKFAKCLQRRFGLIPGVTDKNYITNSYHIHVTEPVDAFTKLGIEKDFQRLSPGGAISYIEVPNMSNNIPAVISVLQFIYNNIMYAELNTKLDNCHVCKYEGEIKMVEDEKGKLIWECPKCGNRDPQKMNVARRVCGYISTNQFNQGRMNEVQERVMHLE